MGHQDRLESSVSRLNLPSITLPKSRGLQKLFEGIITLTILDKLLIQINYSNLEATSSGCIFSQGGSHKQLQTLRSESAAIRGN